jgi:hypothetical protein
LGSESHCLSCGSSQDLSLEEAKVTVEETYTKLLWYVPFGKQMVHSVAEKEYKK